MATDSTAVPRSIQATRLRVGVVLRSFDVPAWQHLTLEKIFACDSATIAVVMLFDTAVRHRSVERNRLLEAFERHEARTNGRGPGACETRSSAALLVRAPTIHLPCDAPTESGLWETVAKDIAEFELDVIVLLNPLPRYPGIEALCSATRFGVWYYQHDIAAPHDAAGLSVGLWEVMTLKPCVKSVLKAALPCERNDRTIHVSYSAIDHFSVTRTRSEHLWKMASFVARKLRHLRECGWQALAPLETATPSHSQCSCGLVRRPKRGAGWLLPLPAYLLWRLYMKFVTRRYMERWILLFDVGARRTDFAEYRKLLPPPDRFWADPHVVARDGAYHVFIEEAPLQTRRGHISVMRMNEDGTFAAPVPVIERPYHLSYPFVFEWRGELYLLPESSEHRTIEVYRCKRFPMEWVLECVLMEDIAAVDTTLVEHDGRWWLFTNVKENEGAAWDELFLFHADCPLSTRWQSHPRNPIVSDVRSARLAGALYREDGQLYRPAQDGSYRYGYGLRLNRVVELTTSSYREEPVHHCKPDWDRSIRAVHSFSRGGRLTVIDGILRQRRPPGRPTAAGVAGEIARPARARAPS